MCTPIRDFLTAYNDSDPERCHMPGHHSGTDITEIDGAIEIIKQSERNTAKLFGAERSLFSCSGSTLAIFAMLSPFAGKRVQVVGSFHRSLADAAILLDLQLVRDPHRQADVTFVTSIDYYGKMTDITQMSTTFPILVDNAHGAYLVFTGTEQHGIEHPLRSGAAMCADSAHKTLPALTGAAYLHIADKRYIGQAEAGLALMGTSSPSYLIFDSLDVCNAHIAYEKERAEQSFSAVAGLKQDLSEAGFLLDKTDLLRITVDANAYGYSGSGLAGELRSRGIVCEMYDSRYVILLFSTITQEKNTRRVFESMRSIPRKSAIPPLVLPRIVTEAVMPPRQAYFSAKRTIPTKQAAGEVCAGVHVSVPPCVPLIIPGEVINGEAAQVLELSGVSEVDVISK